jgi:hypothetical protein
VSQLRSDFVEWQFRPHGTVTAESHIRIALMNRFSHLSIAEIVRLA